MSDERTRPVKIFYSYAHTEDDVLRNDNWLREMLDKQLRHPYIEAWDDHAIDPGRDWEKEIEVNLNNADIILLLISPDFKSSDYCNKEMRAALSLREKGKVEVIPVLVRPTLWRDAPYKDLQLLPTNGKAINSWGNNEDACVDVAQSIWRVIDNVLKKRYIANAKSVASDGRYEDAIKIYKDVVNTFPDDDPFVYKELGEAYFRLGRFPEALQMIEEAIYWAPPNALFYLNKAWILIRQENLEGAFDAFKKAEELIIIGSTAYEGLPITASTAYEEMGNLLAKRKDYATALNAYAKVIKFSTGNKQAYVKKSKMLSLLGKKEEAIVTLDQAISIMPKDAYLYVDRGNLLAQSEKYEEALKDYDTAIKLEPDNIEFRRYKASVHEQLEQWKDAKDMYVSIFKDKKDNEYLYKPYLYKEYGDILFKLKRFSEAVTAYNKAIRLKSDFGQAYSGRAVAYEKLAEQDRARAEELEEKILKAPEI